MEERKTTATVPAKSERGLLIGVRFIASLALSLWIGGMAFFGAMAAPVLFRLTKVSSAPELGPQMVGDMLARFGVLTTICAVLLLICWAVDGVLSQSKGQLLWKVQGALSLLCLGFSIYLGSVLLPLTQAQQSQILPIYVKSVHGQTLSPQETAQKAAFDQGHEAYKRLASLNLYLLLGVMGILVARGVGETTLTRPSQV